MARETRLALQAISSAAMLRPRDVAHQGAASGTDSEATGTSGTELIRNTGKQECALGPLTPWVLITMPAAALKGTITGQRRHLWPHRPSAAIRLQASQGQTLTDDAAEDLGELQRHPLCRSRLHRAPTTHIRG